MTLVPASWVWEWNNNTQENINTIKGSSWLRVLQELPSNLSSISYQFEDIEGLEEMSFEEIFNW